jgi:hypothetical protein
MCYLCLISVDHKHVRFETRIFATCHLWKCRYRVYWNISYSLSILKVIFLKSNSLRFIATLQIKMVLWEGVRNPPWYRKCWPKLLLTKRTFYLYFLISENTRLSYVYRVIIQNYKSTWTSVNYHTFVNFQSIWLRN